MMYWSGNGMSGWGFVLMTISMALFWTLLIVGVITLVRYLGRPGQPTGTTPGAHPRQTPEQLLAERLARGEIDADEYRHRLDTLHGDARGGEHAVPTH